MRRQNKLTGTRRTKLKLETLETRRLLSTVWSDFNSDGFDDLAIGVPGEDSDAGAVHVIYGSAAGLTTPGAQFWTQDAAGVLDTKEAGDQFGAAMAGGDFNNDGRADLAIGAPGESIGSAFRTGAFHILLGSPLGLTANGNQFFHQDTNRVREINETDDRFGSTLAAGHFNSDAFADLVVGIPGEDVGNVLNAGSIHAFYGAPPGIVQIANQFFHLDSGLLGVAAIDDNFGSALTTGDMNGDGRDDVAIGIPFMDVDDGVGVAVDAGAVTVMYSSTTGLSSTGNQLWTQATSGINSTPFLNDNFGFSLASADFNNDGRHDLAIGVPGELWGVSYAQAGSFHVLYGSSTGVTTSNEQFINEVDANGSPNPFNRFAASLVAADFNGDGNEDLAIGTPDKANIITSQWEFGAVYVMFGNGGGISSNAKQLKQEDMGTGDSTEDYDHFGATLSAGDFNGNGRADLVIGAPDEDIGSTVLDTGRVWTVYGASNFSFTGGQSWGQDTSGILDVSEEDDRFGGGLDAGAGRSSDGNNSGRRSALVNGAAPPADPAVRETTPITSVSDHVDPVISPIATLDDDASVTTAIVTRSIRSAMLPPLFAFELDLNNPLA